MRRQYMRRTWALVLAVAFLIPALAVSARAEDQWYRGNLHMHSYWSDGGVFPEEAVSLYRDAGYHFVCLSDHNQSQDDPARYKNVSDKEKRAIRSKSLDRFQKRYPDYGVELTTKTVKGNETKVARLRTYTEFKKLVEIPGRFIVIPGFEPSGGAQNGVQVHSNVINTEKAFPFIPLSDENATLDSVCEKVKKLRAGREKNTIFFLNHPDWKYFDIAPEMIVNRPYIQFFEVINCGPNFPGPKEAWTTDKFWDVVNAFRAADGIKPLLYGVGSDDTHGYDHFYTNPDNSGDGFIMVRAPKLEAQALIDAMYRGDFYVSSGLKLKDVRFDASGRTLTVEVAPEKGVEYTIEFIGTKKGFDRKTTSFDDPADGKKPARRFTVYSDEIGATLKSVKGTKASFTMSDDLLYVRAKIVSTKPAARPVRGKPATQTAWTQPVR